MNECEAALLTDVASLPLLPPPQCAFSDVSSGESSQRVLSSGSASFIDATERSACPRLSETEVGSSTGPSIPSRIKVGVPLGAERVSSPRTVIVAVVAVPAAFRRTERVKY